MKAQSVNVEMGIVQLLRAMAQGEARSGVGRQRGALFRDAADEIERLEKALQATTDERQELQDEVVRRDEYEEQADAEIERLRAGNADLVKTVEVLQERYAGLRDRALEEAAKVIEPHSFAYARIIRALKEGRTG